MKNMMRRVVISTIGTSLLTQQIDRADPAEKDWYRKLRDSANLTLKKTPLEALEIIKTLKERATGKLSQGSTKQIRESSAELNGIYGLYEGQLNQGQQDMHWLIATDTAQGQESAEIVERFLRERGITAQSYTPKSLSTANSQSFADGIDDLLIQLDSLVEGYEKVCFNLVGSFKSLQAYLNTIGMFYADEIIYIFEGANSEVIKIPRLPIKIDDAAIAPHATEFALMAAGAEINSSELVGIQEALVYVADKEATLSNWGRLIWNQVKDEVLSKDLLPFPKLQYQPSFIKDYENIDNQSERAG